jgi:hypothetical protein
MCERTVKVIMADKALRDRLAELMTPPSGDEKSYRQLVLEGHRKPGILMLADYEHWQLTQAALRRIAVSAPSSARGT